MAGTIDTTGKVSNQIMSSTSKTYGEFLKPSCSRNAEPGSP